jgi:hypothetical protein
MSPSPVDERTSHLLTEMTMNRCLLKAKADTLTDAEIAEVLEYISIMESAKEQLITPDPFDELIIRLWSDAIKAGLDCRPERPH